MKNYNKYQEALDWIKFEVLHGYVTESYSRSANMNIDILQELINKENVQCWHSACENPNETGDYLIKTTLGKYEISYYNVYLGWVANASSVRKDISCWKYIEE